MSVPTCWIAKSARSMPQVMARCGRRKTSHSFRSMPTMARC
ncbi:CRISPR-associated DxTHG motif protein [Agrobacterium rosae]|nr:CRISPR-associated DxTHG motif protein [Agrobacterium rosae]